MAVSEGSTVYLHFKCKSNTVIHPFLDDQSIWFLAEKLQRNQSLDAIL